MLGYNWSGSNSREEQPGDKSLHRNSLPSTTFAFPIGIISSRVVIHCHSLFNLDLDIKCGVNFCSFAMRGKIIFIGQAILAFGKLLGSDVERRAHGPRDVPGLMYNLTSYNLLNWMLSSSICWIHECESYRPLVWNTEHLPLRWIRIRWLMIQVTA